MRILCAISQFPGHIDFGGMGYLKLVETLKRQGHEVVWAAPPEHIKRLSERGFNSFLFTQTSLLSIRPFFSADYVSQNYDAFNTHIELLKILHDSIRSLSPDVILLDRVLQLGLLISEQLQIPCVSIGSPGGYWFKTNSGTKISTTPFPPYVEVGEIIKEKLCWQTGCVSSLWANSDYLNVCFLGKTFYGNNPLPNSAHVNHFNIEITNSKRSSIGVSFGNSGRPDELINLLRNLLVIKDNFSSIEVFSGSRKHIYKYLDTLFGKAVNLHEWVKFSDYFGSMKGLAFLGGVGTIWECVNHHLPMLVITGETGDQIVNGHAVERLGLGQCITATNNNDEITGKLRRFLDTDSYHNNITKFREQNNYTDTMDSLVEKIRDLTNL